MTPVHSIPISAKSGEFNAMDSLAGYDSDSDSEPQENHIQAKLPEFDNFVSYSENYSMKTHNLASSFICLPYKIKDRAIFGKCYDKVLREVAKTFPDVKNRYSFHSTIQSKAEVFGRFGLSQKATVNFPHITLFPNLHGDRSKLRQLEKRLRKSLKSVEPPQELVSSQKSALNAMLGKEPSKLALRVDPKLTSYISTYTGNLFIAINIIGPTRYVDTPEKRYLRSLMGMIYREVDALGFKYNWASFVGGDKGMNKEDGLPEVNFHTSIIIGEVKLFDLRLTEKEFDDLRLMVREIDISEYVENLNLEVDTMYLRSNARVSADYPLMNE